MKSGKVKVGLIGCGVMGRSLASELVKVDGALLFGVCDVSRESAERLGNEFGVPSYTDPIGFAAHEELDAVVIATPPFTHRDLTIAAAEAGKHVFCEKPMAPSVTDCLEMIRACERSGVKLMIGQVCRYHLLHRAVKDEIESGELGKLISVFVYRVGGPFSGVWDVPWRRSRAQSGGALMEINTHELDFMRWVGGEVECVFACGGNYICKNWDYPDCAFVSLRYRSGAVGVLHSSQVSAIGGYGCRVDCEGGSILLPSFWGEGAEMMIRRWDGDERRVRVEELSKRSLGSPVWQELKEFIDAIQEGREPEITGYDGMAAVEIAEAAYISIERGEPVKLPLVGR
ncbi:MAG: Gfo/Idh/MocA family oxidoreductase [Armatimonadota bacterium]|nr:Gfo/Idh/MocA family oxidoreductase [Armatimonadota bacterium]MCX7776529.1 Gfo/Idh/MocA family oxidoreductase [Armatimonadota bacterium]MDW8024328.1 Gfo/Idh/MocA family oxidoreductase [Armatimonadota bacterium]